MSTFFHNPPPAPVQASPAFSVTPRDEMLVRDLRGDQTGAMLPRLNKDLGMQMTSPMYRRIQQYFQNTLHRDPSVGELRLLEALDRSGKTSPHRIAVGELTTKSSLLAETWADMMALHGNLHGVGSSLLGREPLTAPPCSLEDAVSLTARYLYRREHHKSNRPLLLSAPWQEAEASAQGYRPVARMAVGGTSYTLWECPVSVPETPCQKGDFLLYIPHTDPVGLRAFVQEAAESDLVWALRAVAKKPFLLTLWELAPSVELYAERLPKDTDADRLPLDALCAQPTVGADGICAYLLRIPMKQVHTVTELLKRHGLTSVVCGRVTGNHSTVIHIQDGQNHRDVVAVRLPTEFLTSMSAVYLYPYQAEIDHSPVPAPCAPEIARLPSPRYRENGLTPEGRETVALTRYEGQLLPIPEADTVITVLSSEVNTSQTAFETAAHTVVTVSDLLAAAGVAPGNMILSVTLTIPVPQVLTQGETLAAICGIHRVAAERGLPVAAHAIRVGNTPCMTVAVAAYAKDPELCHALCNRDDRQWHTPGLPIHKDAPCFLFPVLRRSYEDSLKALSAALNRNVGAGGVIQPVIMDTTEVEIPLETEAEATEAPPVSRKETRYSLNPASVAQLTRMIFEWKIPVFSLNEEDTRRLLASPEITDALTRLTDMGYSILVLGNSCKPFAEAGFLPAALSEVNPLATTGQSATVTYAFPADAATRLLRTDVLTPTGVTAEETRHLLTLHLPDGTTVPDGFVGQNGRVFGLLNGLDTTILPLVQKYGFTL